MHQATAAGRPGGPDHPDSHGGHGGGHSAHRRLKYQHNKDDTYGDDELHRLWISVSWPWAIEGPHIQ
jgi:uncharacterized protein involved in type VI secretion and phage assembly